MTRAMEYRALCTTFQPILPINPILHRRPLTAYGERRSDELVRPQSSLHVASHGKTMSRNHVNIARFYDWSDDLGTCVSVTRLYRDLASMSNVSTDLRRSLGIQWCANGVRLTPGRMFARDKNALTKGEREIINGIYRNRGGPKEHYETPHIKSHQDAWLTGRQLGRASMRQSQASSVEDNMLDRTPREAMGTHRRSIDCTNTYLQGRIVKSASSRSSNSGYYCVKNRPSTHYRNDSYCCGNVDIPSAPPSTPDQTLNPRPRIPPINNGQGATVIEGRREVNQSARRVRMDVFLPRITPEQMEDECEKANLYQQPANRLELEEFTSDGKQQVNCNNLCEKKTDMYSHRAHCNMVGNREPHDNAMRFCSPVCLYDRGNGRIMDVNVAE